MDLFYRLQGEGAVDRSMTLVFTWLSEQWQWITSLDRPFAFLLALPFAVALTGLASHFFRERIAK